MALGKPSEQPQAPAGGWVEDHYKRCQCGTVLIEDRIMVRFEDKPDICIGKAHICLKCGAVHKRWLIPGRYVEGYSGQREYIESPSDLLKITKGHVAHAMAKYPRRYSFTISELKEGTAEVKAVNSKFNSDRFVEPVSDEPIF